MMRNDVNNNGILGACGLKLVRLRIISCSKGLRQGRWRRLLAAVVVEGCTYVDGLLVRKKLPVPIWELIHPIVLLSTTQYKTRGFEGHHDSRSCPKSGRQQ